MPYDWSAQVELHDVIALRRRLIASVTGEERPLVLLVGSAASAPQTRGGLGVPGVREMVELILDEVGDDRDLRQELEQAVDAATVTGDNPYQVAFTKLVGCRSQDTVNRVVRRAAVQARIDEHDRAVPGRLIDDAMCEHLEADLDGWHLTPGLEALGQLVAVSPPGCVAKVLTTNFDPLIEIAIRKAGGSCYRTVLQGDGSLDQTRADGCHVVYLHGHWYGSDTLHAPAQLSHPRPHLDASLRRLLERATLVALGYEGWDDVLIRSLASVLADDGAQADVRWTFFEEGRGDAIETRPWLLQRLADGISRGRAQLYRGVDLHSLLPEVVRSLPREATEERPASEKTAIGGEARISPFVVGPPISSDEQLFGREDERQRLMEALSSCHQVQINGERRMGKTSLLLWFERYACRLGEWPVARISLGGLPGRSPLHLVAAVAQELGRTDLVPSPDELLTIERCDDGRAERILEQLCPLCLLVDEADYLVQSAEAMCRSFLPHCRELGQQGKLQWVSASRQELHAALLGAGHGSAFLNDAIKLTIGHLEPNEARALLAQGLAPEPAETAVELAAGFAFGLQWLGDRCWRESGGDHLAEEYWLQMGPVFEGWWRVRDDMDRQLLREAGQGSPRDGLSLGQRARVVGLASRGLLIEREGVLGLPGAGWREWVRDVD